MKKLWLISFFILSNLFAAQAQAFDVRQQEMQKLPPLPSAHVQIHQLKNGITCYLLEDHEIPVVNLTAWVKVGSIHTPADKVGMATLAGDLLIAGGIKDLTPEQFEQKADDLALHIASNIGSEFGNVSVETLTSTLPAALPLFVGAVFTPSFDEKRLQLGKKHLLLNLQKEQDDPNTYTSVLFHQLMYGENSPWARRPNKKTIASITRADLQKFHTDFFVPSNTSFAISGDFNSAQILAELEKLTVDFTGGTVSFPQVMPVELSFPALEKRVVRKLTQSSIRVGHLGVKRHNPDIYALHVMNAVLGGGVFQSRLMQEIRVKRGLSYNVRSSFGQNLDYGEFLVSTATKASSTEETLGLIRSEIGKMARGEGLTAAELNFAKESLVNKLIFKFESSEQMVNDFVTNRLLGYPENYWQLYLQKVKAVSLADVKKVAAEYLHPDGLKIVVLGPKT